MGVETHLVAFALSNLFLQNYLTGISGHQCAGKNAYTFLRADIAFERVSSQAFADHSQ